MSPVSFCWMHKAILVERLPIVIKMWSVTVVAANLDFLTQSVERFSMEGLRLYRKNVALVSLSLVHS